MLKHSGTVVDLARESVAARPALQVLLVPSADLILGIVA